MAPFVSQDCNWYGINTKNKALYAETHYLRTDGVEILHKTSAEKDAIAAKVASSSERRYLSSVQSFEMRNGLSFNHNLDRPGVEKVADIINLLGNAKACEKESFVLIAPLIFHLCSMLRRADFCFCIIEDILRTKDWYVDKSIKDYRAKLMSFREFVRVLMPQTYFVLNDLGALADEYLHKIFVGLFFEILSHAHAMRIMDSYLVSKVCIVMVSQTWCHHFFALIPTCDLANSWRAIRYCIATDTRCWHSSRGT